MRKCKHKFEPRYDKQWTTASKELSKIAANAGMTNHLKIARDEPYLETQTYIYDICVKCGETIQRS